MNEKEFVLVSQGIEIYRTKSQEDAVNMVKKENDEYFDYRQRCADNYERPADNYIDLEIEYASEKEKDKEIERLNNALKEYDRGTYCKLINENRKLNNIIDKLEIDIEIGTGKYAYDNDYTRGLSDAFIYMNDRLQELKGSDSNE